LNHVVVGVLRSAFEAGEAFSRRIRRGDAILGGFLERTGAKVN
jgi:hypothetical protein